MAKRLKLTEFETECVEYLREYAAEGFPKRVDGSFSSDFLMAIRTLGKVPKEVDIRDLEDALTAGRELTFERRGIVERAYAAQQKIAEVHRVA